MAHVINHKGLNELMNSMFDIVTHIDLQETYKRTECVGFLREDFSDDLDDTQLNVIATLCARYMEIHFKNIEVIAYSIVDTIINIDFKAPCFRASVTLAFLDPVARPADRCE